MTVLSWNQQVAADHHAKQTINDFESETAEITGAPEPFASKFTVMLLAGMVVLAITLASVVRLDRTVTVSGRVVAQVPTIVVQPLDTSIIRSLEVRAGQVVHRGEVLATLDPTFSAADASHLQQETASLQAQVARLEAEVDSKPFSPTDEGPYNALQLSIWHSRKAENQAKILNYDQRIESAISTMGSAKDDVAHYQSRLTLSSEIEKMRQTLEKDKYGSHLTYLQAADARVEISRNLGAAQNTVNTAAHDMRALEAEREAYVQQWRSDTMKELVSARVDLNRSQEELTKATKRSSLIDLRAVDDAVVLEVAPVSVGSVVQSAEKIFKLVPLGSPLEVEADIDGADQGFVKPGDKVEIKLDAYRYVAHGMAKGVVRTISNDSFTQRDDNTVAPKRFYKTRIELTSVSLHDVPTDFHLIPGMPLEADIVIGSHTIISYLLEGALRNMSEGMREP